MNEQKALRIAHYPDSGSKESENICYWKDDQGYYIIYFPGDGLVGRLFKHKIEEHEDGTISVSPSILIIGYKPEKIQRHGYLTRGIWRDV